MRWGDSTELHGLPRRLATAWQLGALGFLSQVNARLSVQMHEQGVSEQVDKYNARHTVTAQHMQ